MSESGTSVSYQFSVYINDSPNIMEVPNTAFGGDADVLALAKWMTDNLPNIDRCVAMRMESTSVTSVSDVAQDPPVFV